MDPEKMEKLSEVGKNVSETVKNFYEVVDAILKPRGINAALINAHTKIIDSYAGNPEIDLETKLTFLSTYKRLIKEHRRCTKTVDLASTMISNDARPEEVREDWFDFFFDKVRLVSDDNFINMWSQILAGEVNQPGRFSRALLHSLSVMSTEQAKLFCSITQFSMREYKNEEHIHPFIFIASNHETYKTHQITAEGLRELENLGLILCDFKDEFIFERKKVFRSGNKIIEIRGNPDNANRINAGNVCFTKDGIALLDIVGETFKQYQSDYLNFIVKKVSVKPTSV